MKMLIIVVALLMAGCGKHPAQQGIEDAFEAYNPHTYHTVSSTQPNRGNKQHEQNERQ